MTREQFDEILNRLQDIEVYTVEGESDVLDELFMNYETDVVANELNVDKHRHYELSTDVYQIEGNRHLGVRYVSQMYSEMSDHYGIGINAEFFEMKREEVKTYKYTKV